MFLRLPHTRDIRSWCIVAFADGSTGISINRRHLVSRDISLVVWRVALSSLAKDLTAFVCAEDRTLSSILHNLVAHLLTGLSLVFGGIGIVWWEGDGSCADLSARRSAPAESALRHFALLSFQRSSLLRRVEHFTESRLLGRSDVSET